MLQSKSGMVLSWLVRSSPDWVVRVRALAGDMVLCSWARHLHVTLTLPLSTQVGEINKWVLANFMLGVTLRWTSIPSREEWKYSHLLCATETGISFGLMGHLSRMHTLTYYSKSGVLGMSPCQGHCVVFLGKTLCCHRASLHPGKWMGTSVLLG